MEGIVARIEVGAGSDFSSSTAWGLGSSITTAGTGAASAAEGATTGCGSDQREVGIRRIVVCVYGVVVGIEV